MKTLCKAGILPGASSVLLQFPTQTPEPTLPVGTPAGQPHLQSSGSLRRSRGGAGLSSTASLLTSPGSCQAPGKRLGTL